MNQKGFSLAELMVVVAIMAILAAVAVPAYVNYLNRMRQADAAAQLLIAHAEQEQYRLDNGRYAEKAACLPSFGGDCSIGDPVQGKYYEFAVENAGTDYFRLVAERNLYGNTDKIYVSADTREVQVANPDAIKFSLVKMLFE
jgi:type IV pilus assembly protein PilE